LIVTKIIDPSVTFNTHSIAEKTRLLESTAKAE